MTLTRPGAPAAQWMLMRPRPKHMRCARPARLMRRPIPMSSMISMRRDSKPPILEVGGPAEKVEGAEADGVAFCFGVGDAPGARAPEAEDLKEAEDGGFVPALDEGGGEE